MSSLPSQNASLKTSEVSNTSLPNDWKVWRKVTLTVQTSVSFLSFTWACKILVFMNHPGAIETIGSEQFFCNTKW